MVAAFMPASSPAGSYHDWMHETKVFVSPAKMRKLLDGWDAQRPDCVEVEVIGKSWMARPPRKEDTPKTDILALHVTDETVPDDDKQVVLIAAMRVVFSTTPGTVLHTARWLLSDDPLARETRRRQHVIFVPSPRPYYAAIGGMISESLYDHWSWDGVADPKENIESAAIQVLIDRWQPDVFVDLSGRVCHTEAMTMESVGLGSRSSLNSCFVPKVTLLLAEAAAAQGYQVLGQPPYEGYGIAASAAPVQGAEPYYCGQSWKVLPTDYAYRRYHTLGLRITASFRESFLLMMKRLFAIGNSTWEGERHAGYPVDAVGGCGPAMVVAWGRTVAERRTSRVELWQKKSQVGVTYAVDPRPNVFVGIVTTDSGRVPELFAHGPRSLNYGNALSATFDILENIEKSAEGERFDLDPVRGLIARYWRGSRYSFRPRGWHRKVVDPVVRHGLGIRCLFPYLKPGIREVRLDGHACKPSGHDGYSVTHGPGTLVEIAIPPEKVAPFHVVSVELKPDRSFEQQDESLFWKLDTSSSPSMKEGQ